jgi:hypothetical protein
MREYRQWWLSLLLILGNPAFVLSFQASLTTISSNAQRTQLHASASSRASAVEDYCQLVQKSIDDGVFGSLKLKGCSKKAGTKDELRGCIAVVQGRLVDSPKQDNSNYLQATLKYHGATDVCKNWKVTEAGKMLQELLEATDDDTTYKSEWGTWHPSGTKFGLRTCTLITTSSGGETTELDLKKKTIHKKKQVAAAITSTEQQQQVVASHDRTKQVPVSDEAPFWQAIGLTTKTAKRRQCQKFVEIVGNLVLKQQVLKQQQNDNEDNQEESSSISTIDMGCGRGYLTFSLHHYLQDHFTHVQTRGIDMRPKLVAEMNTIATDLQTMDGLTFETGTIESFLEITAASPQTDNVGLQILIALHACDTATDDALWSGIQSQAEIIVVAPCCHKQIRPQLDYAASRNKQHPLKDVLRHGIYRERMAETVTDSMRALLLELAHYQVSVFEFIGGEHTSKNVMITAVKRSRRRSAKEMEDLRERLKDLARLNGVRSQTLAQWMEEDLGQEIKATRLSTKVMPPI